MANFADDLISTMRRYECITKPPAIIMSNDTLTKVKAIMPEMEDRFDTVPNDLIEGDIIYIAENLSNFHNSPKYNPRNF